MLYDAWILWDFDNCSALVHWVAVLLLYPQSAMPCTPSSKLHTPCRLHALMNEGKDQVPEEHQGMDSETFHPPGQVCIFVSYGRVGVVVIDMLCILYGRGSGCGPWLIGRQTVWFMMVGTVWLLAISRAHRFLTRIWKCRKFFEVSSMLLPQL